MILDTGKEIDSRITQIANKLRELRKARGYSSAETFAYEHSFNRVSYWRIENGQNITIVTLLRVLDVHGVTLAEFFADMDSHD